MIDFVKFQIKGIPPEQLEGNILLEYEQRNLTNEGALIERKDKDGNTETDKNNNLLYKTPFLQAFYKGLEFRIYETGYITIEGSLHKYWNNGSHNFNDFGINEIDEVVKGLNNKFGIKPINCVLRQLEIGVNINTPIRTKTLLKHCLLHKTSRLKWIFTKDEGNYIQAQHQRQILKIYDKRTHYEKKGFNISKEILRIEVKYRKMIELNAKGIYTLQDLLKYGLEKFTPVLLKKWQEVIFYDYKAIKGTQFEQTYSNPNYWDNLTYEGLKYHRANLNKLLQKHPDNLKFKIAELIKVKAEFLNTSTTEINPLSIRLKPVVSTPGNKDPNRRFCKVTGFNISMQRDDSFLLSHTGLKYYYKTDKKIFEEVKRKYLSKLWQKADHKTQIKQIAHNIRHRHNTLRRKQERLYTPGQHLLFDLAI